MTNNSFMMFKEYALPEFKDKMKVLEIGAIPYEHKYSLQKLLEDKFNLRYDNSDFDKGIKFIDGKKLDSLNNVYDIVFCANVIEHVARPWIWIKELVRVTKKGGKVIILGPINWGYHESPLDCWRVFPDGMRILLTDSGLKIEKVKMEKLDNNDTNIDCIGIGKK